MLAWHRFASVHILLLAARFVPCTVWADDPDDFGSDRYLCPPDTQLVRDGQCRGHCGETASSTPLQGLINQCQPVHALPVTIKTAEQQNYWLNRLASFTAFPIGIVCDESTKKYKWIDGATIEYKPDSYDAELNGECRSDVWWQLTSTGGWHWTTNSGANSYNFKMCCVADIYHPELSDDDCTDFSDDKDDSVCYQISQTLENLSDAQKICKSAGSTVSSVHNDHENSYLRRLAVSRGFTTGLMLGASVGISGKSDTFGWVDGSDWDYTNFIPGFPYDGFGDCLAMSTNDAYYQWANMECSEKLPFVCARKSGSVPAASTTCPGPAVNAGDIITSPGYPTNASIPCDFFLKVETGKKVQMEILLLEANTCCDKVQIYEGTLGGNFIASETGVVTTKTYTSPTNQMRVSWQPNGGVNVRGLKFKFTAM